MGEWVEADLANFEAEENAKRKTKTTPEAIVKKLAEEEDRFERVAGDLPGNDYARGCADGAHWQTATIKGLLEKEPCKHDFDTNSPGPINAKCLKCGYEIPG